MSIRIGIAGVNGRMGGSIIAAMADAHGAILAGGLIRPDAARPPQPNEQKAQEPRGRNAIAPDMMITDDCAALLPHIDVLIDFSTTDGAVQNAALTASAGKAAVIGVTGFTPAQDAQIRTAAGRCAIVKSGNMSLGVNMLAHLVREAAARLGEAYDIEIAEAHHRAKIDAPSGTALLLGEAAADGRTVTLTEKAQLTREGQTGARPAGEIGFAVTRGGGIVGDHAVSLIGDDEMITLSHRALNRSLFAKGAIAAAVWVSGQKTGLYGMADVLGLNRP